MRMPEGETCSIVPVGDLVKCAESCVVSPGFLALPAGPLAYGREGAALNAPNLEREQRAVPLAGQDPALALGVQYGWAPR